MQPQHVRRIGFASNVLLIALGQFLGGMAMAIVLFPGSYSLMDDYISYLGCARRSSHFPALIFNTSLGLFALSLCFYFHAIIRATLEGPIELLVISSSGLMSSVSVLFVAVLPWDTFPRAHTIAMLSWLMFLLPAVTIWIEWIFTLSTEQLRKRGGSFTLGKSLRIFVVLFPVAALLGAGPALQKLLVLLCLIWLVLFSFQLRQAIRDGKVQPGFAGQRRKKSPEVYPEPGTFDGFHD